MTVPWPELESALTNLRFALIAEQESKRTLLVPTEDYDRAMWHVEQAGVESLVTVLPSQLVQPGTWWIVDEQAMDAAWEETAQRLTGRWP